MALSQHQIRISTRSILACGKKQKSKLNYFGVWIEKGKGMASSRTKEAQGKRESERLLRNREGRGGGGEMCKGEGYRAALPNKTLK
jgi:hypothetical protein